jgi:CRISPR system Cascade subunit CasD
MTDFLLLRFEAPLLSFGGPVVDALHPTRLFPSQSQITGMLGNAVGYHHRDHEALEALQQRLRVAAGLIRGEMLLDYQTVDLGLPAMVGTGWTTRGSPEEHGGGSGRETHIRYRWHLADALAVVALTLVPADDTPSLDEIAECLDHPARPLFIGRKSCLPTAPIRLGRVDAVDASAALREAQGLVQDRSSITVEMDARLAVDVTEFVEEDRLVDRRDWRNQVHTRQRGVVRFAMEAPL